MVKTLHVSVNNKIASYWQRDGVIVCGNSDYVIEFTFDSEWDDHQIKTARFISANGYSDVVFEGTTVAVPVVQNTERLTVGVFSGNLKTTTPAVIPCMKSILCGEGVPVDPPPDVYTQLMEKMNGLEEGATIPTFDLVALGLAVIDVEGEAVSLDTDTSDMLAALEKGAVRFRVNVEYRGLSFDCSFTMHDISGGLCSYAFDAIGGLPMLMNLTITEGHISAGCTLLAGDSGGETPTAELPTFDLATLGLPSVPLDGTQVAAQMDTTEIMAALDKGAVKFIVKFLFGTSAVTAEVVMNKVSVDAAGIYICSYAFDFEGVPMVFNLYIQDGGVMAYYIILAKAELPATSIDLSALDSEGKIVETYADGTTKTTSLEFDADGNPVKITDADGNVTTLTW